ncbi:MAG: MFS transporter [Arachnia sp.]
MSRRQSWLPLAAILVLAFNLRPVAISVGPVLEEISRDVGLSAVGAGLLTSLPTLAFAVFGALAPGLARRLGAHVVIGIALVGLLVGQIARALVDSAVGFLLLSILALGGMALANVLLPSLVRLHFPHRVGLATALYSLVMTMGVTAASAGTVPLAQALGGWQAAFIAAAALAVAALVCWIPLLIVSRRQPSAPPEAGHTMAAVARTRLGWAMALFFGIQSAQAYSIFGWLPSVFRSAGLSDVDAGFMLGIATGVGIIPSFLIPAYVARAQHPQRLFLVLVASLVIGFVGLLVAPAASPAVWSFCLAIGTASFPLILALFGLRARTASATAALSGFTQAIGYLIATAGPLLFGTLYAWTGGWTASIGLQLALVIPMVIVGLYSLRPQYIEDQLP